MILYRAFQGIGGTMIFTTGVAILISVFPPEERGRVLGINVAAVYSGLSLGPVIGGFLTHYLTWRSVFLINIPFGLIIIYLIFTRLKGEWAEARGEKFDLAGSIIFGIAITLLMVGMSQLPAMRGLWIMPFGILGIWAFIKWELRIDNPLVEMDLFKQNRVFAFSNTAALIHYSATFALTFLLSLYLQYIKGLNPRSAGLILVFQPAMMALFSPAAGWLSDKVEARIVASTGMTITAVGLFLLIFLDMNTSFSSIIVILILLGFGFALFSSPNANIIMGSIEKRLYGVASGMVGTMRTFGMMVSMSIVNLLIAMMIGRVQITAEYFPAYLRCMRVTFIIFSCLCLIGISLSMARGKFRPESQKLDSID
jgi:MFS family permease